MAKIILEPADQSREILSKCIALQVWLGVDQDPQPEVSAAALIYIFAPAFENPDDTFNMFVDIFPVDDIGGTRVVDGNGSMLVFQYAVGTRMRFVELSDDYPKEAEARAFVSVFESILQEFLENASAYVATAPKKHIKSWEMPLVLIL